jgi:hypothetical protein
MKGGTCKTGVLFSPLLYQLSYPAMSQGSGIEDSPRRFSKGISAVFPVVAR